MKNKTNIFVAGHKGMVGSSIVKSLAKRKDVTLILKDKHDLDLTNQNQVSDFFKSNRIDQVYLAAAKVGGIYANNCYPAEFIYDNLMIQNNVIHAAYVSNVEKLLFLGSSCIYPKFAKQPMLETALLSGALEPTNEAYAIAKIAGIKLCESYNRQYGVDYRSVMPTNLYGPNDNFHSEHSHVVPALIRRLHEAKLEKKHEVVIWGSGKPKREFLYVDDMAAASIYLMDLDLETYRSKTKMMSSHVNIGTGQDCTIVELVDLIKQVIGYEGAIVFDTTKPDGPPRKLLDVSLMDSMGWKASTSLKTGVKKTYEWFLSNQSVCRI